MHAIARISLNCFTTQTVLYALTVLAVLIVLTDDVYRSLLTVIRGCISELSLLNHTSTCIVLTAFIVLPV